MSKAEATAKAAALLALHAVPPPSSCESLFYNGADPHAYCTTTSNVAAFRQQTVLHALFYRGLTDLVKVVMDLSTPLDLTQVDENGCTVLHYLCSTTVPLESAEEMLRCVHTRLTATNLITKVCWEQRELKSGYTFLDAAAASGRLSAFWDIVGSRLLPRRDTGDLLKLRSAVEPEDWAKLPVDCRSLFIILPDALEFTHRLEDHVDQTQYEPSITMVGACVAHDADVMTMNVGWELKGPLLAYFFLVGNVNVVKALLETRRRIDFTTVEGTYGNTPLHCIVILPTQKTKNPETVAELLQLVIKRIRSHPTDIIDWKKNNFKGHSPFSLAAQYSILSTFANTLRVEPSLWKEIYPIPLTCEVSPDDWRRMDQDLQEYFQHRSYADAARGQNPNSKIRNTSAYR
eukprot:gene12126-8347_t